MTDFFLPPDMPIASATPNLDANTAAFSSPTVGSTRTAERLGDRLRFQINFSTVNDNAATARQRGRMISMLMSLRGQAGRVWMTPPGATLRGSFPATELFTNNDFSSGATGWSTDSQYSIAAIDRGIRATRISAVAASFAITQAITRIAGIPYALRGFVTAGKGSIGIDMIDSGSGVIAGPVSQGMIEGAYTTQSGVPIIGFYDPATSGGLAGNYFDAKWASFSQCALVDNGVNLLLNSDTLGTGWSFTAGSISAGGATAPDGTNTAMSFTETTANSQHISFQTITTPAFAADYSFSAFVKASNRSWCYIAAFDGTNTALAWFNLSTGAIGSTSIGTNFTLISQRTVSCGNGWYRCVFTFRKGSSSTNLALEIGSATADAVASFAGTASVALFIWRASAAQSSVPVAPIKTTSAAITGTLQTGLQLNLKGLPVSTQGLLLPGDWNECNSQLNQMAAPLDSDAAGTGTAILTRPPRNSPADGTGFVVNTPMGKFMVSSNSTGWNENPGRLSDASFEVIEDISF